MNTPRFNRLFLLAASAMLLGGCVTGKVWEDGQFARYHEPAGPLGLRLYHSNQRQDVLVEYVEAREGDGATQRRAYWLDRNAARLGERRKPHFVALDQAQVLEPTSAPIPASPSGFYAIASTNGTAFTLYSAGKELGNFDLPVYRDPSGRVKQVLLTPPAVVIDFTVGCAVVAV